MIRPSSLILPLLVAILAPTLRSIAENLQKNEPWNQNSSRDPKSAPNLPETAEKSPARFSKIKQKWWTVARFHTFRYSHPPAKKDTKRSQNWSEKETQQLWPGPFCVDPGPRHIHRDPMIRPSSPILSLLVAILAPTWRNIAENLPKSEPWNQNNSREPKSAPTLPKTAEKSPSRPSKIKQKWWTVVRFHTFRYSHPPAKKDTKRFQNWLEIVPKEATKRPSWPSWQHLGDSWAQLAPNLVPTWSILLHLHA